MATIEDLVGRAFEDSKKVYTNVKNKAEENHHHIRYLVKKASDNEVDITFNFRKPQYGQGILSCAKKLNGGLHNSGYVLTIRKIDSGEILMSISNYLILEQMFREKYPHETY